MGPGGDGRCLGPTEADHCDNRQSRAKRDARYSQPIQSGRSQRLRRVPRPALETSKVKAVNMSAVTHSKQRRPVRVFVSHSNADLVFARKLGNLLSQRVNAQVFTTEDLSAGEKWETKLRHELASADVVLALLTPNSVDSSWVLHEIGAAWALGKPIISVITRRDVRNKMPVPLENTKAIELTDVESKENADRFVGAFEDSLGAAHIA